MPPSVGGEKEITDYIKLFDYDVNLLVEGDQGNGGEVAWTSTSSGSWPRPSSPA